MVLIDKLIDFVFGLFSRKRVPVLEDPHRFSQGGVSFDYPRNWKIDKVEDRDGFLNARLDGAMGATFVVTVLRPDPGMELADYVKGAVQGFHGAIDEAFALGRIKPVKSGHWSIDPSRRAVAGRPREGVTMDVPVRAFGQEVISRFEIHEVRTPAYVAFVLVNATGEDWGSELAGFELLWRTLRIEPAGRA